MLRDSTRNANASSMPRRNVDWSPHNLQCNDFWFWLWNFMWSLWKFLLLFTKCWCWAMVLLSHNLPLVRYWRCCIFFCCIHSTVRTRADAQDVKKKQDCCTYLLSRFSLFRFFVYRFSFAHFAFSASSLSFWFWLWFSDFNSPLLRKVFVANIIFSILNWRILRRTVASPLYRIDGYRYICIGMYIETCTSERRYTYKYTD